MGRQAKFRGDVRVGGDLNVIGRILKNGVAVDASDYIDETAGDAVDATHASITADSVAANSNLTLTAKEFGTSGHTLSLRIVQGTGALSVTVDGRAIIITLAEGGNTATEVKAAYDAVAAATTLATCAVEGDGSGAVDVMAATGFAGAVNATTGPVPCYKLNAAGTALQVKVSPNEWKTVALA